MRRLRTPFGLSSVLSLKAGDVVYLSGRIFTARDAAYRRMLKEKNLPFGFKESLVLFHAGPIMGEDEEGHRCVSLGPTTSSRMDEYEPEVIKRFGVRAIIGKGGMDENAVLAMREKCVYLAFPGGCAAVGASMVRRVLALHWPELGMAEGVWELEVEDFGPLVVAIDARGNSLYGNERKKKKK